jgi:hypothetical protein
MSAAINERMELPPRRMGAAGGEWPRRQQHRRHGLVLSVAVSPRLLLLALALLHWGVRPTRTQFKGGPLLRRIGVPYTCADDVDQVLAAQSLDCPLAEKYLENVGGCEADLHDGVGMAALVPEGSLMSLLCPVHCGRCPSDDVFAPPPAQDSPHSSVMAALGRTERARAGAVCNGEWERLEGEQYCAGEHGVDLVDLNPRALPMTLEQCQAAALAEPGCGDVLASNAATNPTGGGHPSEYFHCRCAHVDAPKGCRSRPSSHGTALYRCRRTVAAGGESGAVPPGTCRTGYPHKRRSGTAPRGTPCMFPFVWRGVEHHECIPFDGNLACEPMEPPWIGAISPTADGTGAADFAYKGMGCAAWAVDHCADGLLGWWVTSVPVDRYGRRADEACCECGGGRFSGESVPWCLTTEGGAWGECEEGCPRGSEVVLPPPPPPAHCAPMTPDGAGLAAAPGSNGQPGGAMAALLAGVYDLSDCRTSLMGRDGGLPVPVVTIGTECRVGCAAGRRRVGPKAVFSCPPDNTSPHLEPIPYALQPPLENENDTAVPVELSELPTCFELIEKNSMFSPPQGISVRCAEAFNLAAECTLEIRRKVCGGTGDVSCSAGPDHCTVECQEHVDGMYAACDQEDGWSNWKIGLAGEVGKAGCGGASRPSPGGGGGRLWLLAAAASVACMRWR